MCYQPNCSVLLVPVEINDDLELHLQRRRDEDHLHRALSCSLRGAGESRKGSKVTRGHTTVVLELAVPGRASRRRAQPAIIIRQEQNYSHADVIARYRVSAAPREGNTSSLTNTRAVDGRTGGAGRRQLSCAYVGQRAPPRPLALSYRPAPVRGCKDSEKDK